ncbi:NAC domain-containing protein 100 [Sorghum bicolor]|uniref:NAC domain-containing protein n=1 Tax=Sorghum bicolor TaxID=4558 RepID=C5YV73_SORBI|nr:NAC domain-containing protein 100 [Sorghum bicolor]EES17917.1 hypothetical protein SORBI_3009G086800 [Sorghum bicolor]|eukprot:XP_002439487.1 NAC domain-containing protein 100 [Sorghum bicolor]
MADQQQPQQEEMNIVRVGGLDLLPGFRFHPNDFEIVNDYLMKKVHNRDFICAIGEVDLNKTEPWDLPREAKMNEKEWYFFSKKDRKYPTGLRANRATEAGYWKATGKDKEVYKPSKGEGVVLLIGMKKTLVFYEGRAPRGNKTNWVMHEYRLEGNSRVPSPTSASSSTTNATIAIKGSAFVSKDEWVICRVFHKTTGIRKTTIPAYQVAMPDAEIDQNQNNTLAIPVPMQLQLPQSMPMPMQCPILPDFSMDPVPPYYPNSNTGIGMPLVMPPMAGIGGTGGLQINGSLFNNPMVVPPSMNFYHQMGMGSSAGQMGTGEPIGQMDMGALVGQMGIGPVAQMDMGAASASGFNVAMSESRPSSMVLQKDEQANAAEITSMMSVSGPGSATTTIEIDGIWKYKY